MNTTDLNAQITQQLEELARLTDAARFSEAMQAYLDTAARFHKYSWHNQVLIRIACPTATQVAGFHDWLKLKRYVKKGAKGIPILAPCRVKPKTEEDKERLFFKVVYVFDVSMTGGEPLPPQPEWRSREQQAALQQKLLAFAAQKKLAVSVVELPENVQGLSRGGAIGLSRTAGTKTLVHELAHELLCHHDTKPDRKTRECEAESVAYVVAKHFGLGGLNSPNYLVLQGAGAPDIRKSLEAVCACAAQIINGVEEVAKPA